MHDQGKTNRFLQSTYDNILTCKLFNKIIFISASAHYQLNYVLRVRKTNSVCKNGCCSRCWPA
jgi:hypothetical protein